MRKLQPKPSESRTTSLLRAEIRKCLDEKCWTSINALHWITCFLDPSFKHVQLIPSSKRDDAKFKRGLIEHLDAWVLGEMGRVEEVMTACTAASSDDTNDDRYVSFRLQIIVYV